MNRSRAAVAAARCGRDAGCVTGSQGRQHAPCRRLLGCHLFFHAGHRGFVGFSDVWRLEHLDLAHRRDGGCDERLHAPGVLRRVHGSDRRQGIPERVSRLLRGTERHALGLEVGVLDRQFEDVAVQHAILCKPAVEFLEHLGLVRVAETAQNRRQRAGIFLDPLRGLLGFTREGDGRFVGVRHYRAIRGVSGLGELNAEVGREPARLDQPLKRGFWRTDAARRSPHRDSGEHKASRCLDAKREMGPSGPSDWCLHPHRGRR